MLFSKLLMVVALGASSMASASIQGLYQADCLPIEDQGLSLVRSVSFDKVKDQDVASQAQIIYTDLTCEAAAYSFIFAGPYTIAADGAADFTSASIQLTALDARVAASFTQQKLCGIETWEVGKAQEVAGLDCGGSTIPAAGSITYDRVKEVETGIVFGAATDTNDGTSADKRPADYDETTVFKAVTPKQ